MPRTSLGRWTLVLAAAFLVLLVVVVALGPAGAGVWESGTVGSVVMFVGVLLTGLAAFTAGLVSRLRMGDRSWLVLAAAVLSGVLVGAILLLQGG